ncbi:unnamed protein product [Moneuplotes crassus]|uniref:Uncharacterized protein n=1 Tax=Euplotes crassus TaxID=5936 RepID=A0AAD1UH05_EUPCR|nr:unnamed protein product [Moneuplotes crassus]
MTMNCNSQCDEESSQNSQCDSRIFNETGLLNFKQELDSPFAFNEDLNLFDDVHPSDNLDMQEQGNLGVSKSTHESQEKISKSQSSSNINSDCNNFKTSKTEQLIEELADIQNCKGSPRSRWGREKDKILFQEIRLLERTDKLSIPDILALKTQEDCLKDDDFMNLRNRVGWNAAPKKLLARIKYCCSTDFSCREIKLLKKILKKEHFHDQIDLEKIIYHFPGKTMTSLKKVIETLTECRKNKVLSKFKNSELFK